jgi:LETM1 and EF-hand domain-containing protein 1
MHYRNLRQMTLDFIHHFWTGTKLLAADARLSWRILKRMAQGKQLTRRERNILIGTGSDLARLVPFSFFIIVPFMEFALPLALRLFPNMIPSHFQDKKKKEEDLKRQLKARLELAKYLQDVVEEKARMIRSQSSADDDVRKLANELTEFLQKLREHQSVDQWDVLRFARLFKDEITLENATREQLVAMCRYMGIAPHGSDSFLRYRLRAKLASIKNDDMLIAWEGGVKNLTDEEVAQACRDRGIRTEGLSVTHQRMMLAEWIELSQNREIPGSLMILSRAFFYTMDPDKALEAALSSLPHEVVQGMQTSADIGDGMADTVSASASAADRRSESERRLAEVRRQERLMELEEQNAAEREAVASSVSGDSIDVESHRKPETATLPEAPKGVGTESTLRPEMVPATPRESQVAAEAALQRVKSEAPSKPDREKVLRRQFEELNVGDRKEAVAMISAALEEMLHPIVAKERQEIEQLKLELAQAMAGSTGSDAAATTPEVERLKRFIARLENECALVEQKVGDALKLLDRDNDGFISVREIVDAIAELRYGQPLTAGRSAAGVRPPSLGTDIDPDSVVAEVLRRLDLDADGIIQPEDVRRLAAQVASERLGLASRSASTPPVAARSE